ncbi:HET-domain-containing protein [Colletotrichum asianum]
MSQDKYTCHRLGEEIDKEFLSNHKGQKFLPYDKLDGLVGREKVEETFEDAGLHGATALVDFVRGRSRKIFLILTLMSSTKDKKLNLLMGLLENSVTDDWLPVRFIRDEDSKKWFLAPIGRPQYRKAPLSSSWDRIVRDSFESYQWRINVPLLDPKTQFNFKFASGTVLPYLGTPTNSARGGVLSDVSCYKIHTAHINLPDKTKASGNAMAFGLKKANGDVGLAKLFEGKGQSPGSPQNDTISNLLRPIVAYEVGRDRYLLFPWPHGGSLSDYWDQSANRPLGHDQVQWIMGEFRGMFIALAKLHDSNCVHGDLKPDNILWFTEAHGKGELQIADLGLAAFNASCANIRRNDKVIIRTTTPTRSSRYEPPEADGVQYQHGNASISRSYDIWAMGCVMLELLIWLAYGNEDLKTFQQNTPDFFWERAPRSSSQEQHRVQQFVQCCISVMQDDFNPGTIYSEILDLVQFKLLVVNGPGIEIPLRKPRATAYEVDNYVREIYNKCLNDPSYLIVRSPRHAASPCSERLFREDRPDESNYQEQSSKLNDIWQSRPDEETSAVVFKSISWDKVKPEKTAFAEGLCARCTTIKITKSFQFTCDASMLQPACKLCTMLLEAITRENIEASSISLRQTYATISIEDGPALLSIYTPPGLSTLSQAQTGSPRLPDQGSREQFALLKEWIRSCDDDPSHERCRQGKYLSVATVPTRLIDVQDGLRLVTSLSDKTTKYVALSHCWGKLEDNQRFCLFKDNIDQFHASITFDLLPQNFKDAVIVTRGLGLQYLWIDSVCIVQDDAKDWQIESAKMEEVFSSAYVTLSAVSATSSLEGFLGERSTRAYIQLETENHQPLYVSPSIDDFHHDVELGDISKRGWVLQERALSRRSIYYTSTQVYWECGAGVRCETMRRLYNSKAAFLGDPNFPLSALHHYRDGKEILIQDLYERYSALAFSHASDRSVAILGLEKRLARALETQASYGLFAKYLHRGLLWKRNQPEPMKRIQQPAGRQVPSWSWISKEGVIKYVDLKSERVEWTNELEGIFTRASISELNAPSSRKNDSFPSDMEVFSFGLNMKKEELTLHATFDESDGLDHHGLRCVIIGRERYDNSREVRRLHCLVIQEAGSIGNGYIPSVYERVGVASLWPRHLSSDRSTVRLC